MLKLRQFVPSEVCLKCDRCCRYREKVSLWSPVFSGEEAERLIEEGVAPSVFMSGSVGYTDIRIEVLEYGDGFVCPFFNVEKNNCKIYPMRPLDCSIYPFLLVSNGDKISLSVDCDCPYVQGKMNEGQEEHIHRFANYLRGILSKTEGIREIEQRPQMVAPYEGNLLFLCELSVSRRV